VKKLSEIKPPSKNNSSNINCIHPSYVYLYHSLILKTFHIFCRYHYNVDGRRKHVLPQEGKFVLTQDQGLVIIGLAEKDAGQYDCRVNHETINSYR
jgi:hypothetical protein